MSLNYNFKTGKKDYRKINQKELDKFLEKN